MSFNGAHAKLEEQSNSTDSDTEEYHDDESQRNRPLLAIAGLVCLFSVGELWQAYGKTVGRTIGVTDALPRCLGEGRPGGPAPDIHLHFLMMTMEDVPHPDIWKQFFKGAPPGSYSAWVHCKYPDKCKADLAQSGLSDIFQIVPAVYNAWCVDLVSPELQLYRSALAQKTVPEGIPEKFILMSGDTLPIKPFTVIREELGKHPFASDFCIYPTTWWSYVEGDMTTLAPSASQWNVLAREDAETLVSKMPQPSPDHPVQLPPAQGKTWDPVTDSTSSPGEIHHDHCPDEVAVLPTIFGLHRNTTAQQVHMYPGVGHVSSRVDYAFKLQGCCRFWGWQVVNASSALLAFWAPRAPPAALLMRVMEAGDSDVHGDDKCRQGACEALASVYSLGPKGAEVLRQSGFLFARKFPANASLPEYAAEMFDA